MEDLLRPVIKRICSMLLRTNSSTTYCTIGLRATGNISFGCDLVAGSSRVPIPATGTIALLITPLTIASHCLYIGEEEAKNNKHSMNIPEQLEMLRRTVAKID